MHGFAGWLDTCSPASQFGPCEFVNIRTATLCEREVTRLFGWAQGRDDPEWLSTQPSRHASDPVSLFDDHTNAPLSVP
jgi:hypothetical protein